MSSAAGGSDVDEPSVIDQPRFVLHITSTESWLGQRHGGRGFRDPSLDREGFIHCSTLDQFLIPANERFAGRNDLVLLVVDSEHLDADLVYEDCYESGMAFPHIYGPIPIRAVIDVVPLPVEPDGRFSEPEDLRRIIEGHENG